jgi:hypothetical protein
MREIIRLCHLPKHRQAQDLQANIEAVTAARWPYTAPPPRQTRRLGLSNLSHSVKKEAATVPGDLRTGSIAKQVLLFTAK